MSRNAARMKAAMGTWRGFAYGRYGSNPANSSKFNVKVAVTAMKIPTPGEKIEDGEMLLQCYKPCKKGRRKMAQIKFAENPQRLMLLTCVIVRRHQSLYRASPC